MIVISNFRSKYKRRYSGLVIFDKDGTLVKDQGYVHKINDFEWNSSGLELLKIASLHKACICVMSNQSGIEKKLYSRYQSIKFCKHLIRKARELDIDIRKIIICPHKENSSHFCNCRKPEIGMYLKLRKYLWARNIKTIMVGNSATDFEFSKNCGIPYIDVGHRNSPAQMMKFLKIK